MVTLTRALRRQLLATLNALAALDSPAGRDRLLHDLPDALVRSLARQPAKDLDLDVIIDACARWQPAAGTEHPLLILIENALDVAARQRIAGDLQAVLDALQGDTTASPLAAAPGPKTPPATLLGVPGATRGSDPEAKGMFTVAPVPFPQAQQQINSPAHTDIVEPSQGNSSDGNTASPDVVLYIQRLTANGQDQLQFSYLWPQEAQLDMTMAGTITLNNVETWAQGQYAELSKSAHFMPTGDGSDAAAVQRAARALEKIGENLYDMLFPAPLKAFYKQFAPKARTVLIYSTEPWIPWEIIKPYGLDLDSDCCEFLCARFQVARWLTSEQSKSVPRRVTVHELCPVIPPSNLVAAQQESAYIKSLPQIWPPLTLYTPPPRDADEVLEALSAGTANLFHFATHANFSPADPTKAAIQIGTSQITPADLTGNKILRGLTTSRPFVCINACHSGRISLALSGIGGWVDKLLRCGCDGFLGTNWEAHDDLAAQFAIAFYTGLQQGQAFGEACRQARLQIRAANPGNSTWLAYVLYAHPNGTMQTG